MKRMRSKLPAKPSALLTLALNDLAKAERNPKYQINMRVWHDPDATDGYPNGRCSVCFAGSVMANTLKAPLDASKGPDCYPSDTCDRLEALNHFRMSQWGSGLAMMCSHLSERKRDRVSSILYAAVPFREDSHYSVNRRRFKLAMRRAARILCAHNL